MKTNPKPVQATHGKTMGHKLPNRSLNPPAAAIGSRQYFLCLTQFEDYGDDDHREPRLSGKNGAHVNPPGSGRGTNSIRESIVQNHSRKVVHSPDSARDQYAVDGTGRPNSKQGQPGLHGSGPKHNTYLKGPPAEVMKKKPTPSEARGALKNENVVAAMLALLKELDLTELDFIQREVSRRMGSLLMTSRPNKRLGCWWRPR